MLTLERVNFRAETNTRDKEVYFMIMKESIHQDDVTILNKSAPSN